MMRIPVLVARLPTRQFILAAVLLVTIVFVPAFVQLPGNSLLWRELQNTGHTLLFLIAAPAILLLLRKLIPVTGNRPRLAYLSAALTALAVGIGVELLQLSVHRGFSMNDVLRDLSGILCGLGIYAAFDKKIRPFWRRYPGYRIITLLVVAGLCMASLFPLLRLAIAYAQRDDAFPAVIDFNAGWSQPFLRFDHSILQRGDKPGHRIASLRLNVAKYPGVSMLEPYPDWSGYEHLVLGIHSEHPDPFRLVLRIHDHHHNQAYSDRFNRSAWIERGENRLRIPLADIRTAPAGREMDMSRITGITLFAIDLANPVIVRPGVLHLE